MDATDLDGGEKVFGCGAELHESAVFLSVVHLVIPLYQFVSFTLLIYPHFHIALPENPLFMWINDFYSGKLKFLCG
jgi:hypothetical protein